jgi:hypothetical protein
LEAALCSLDILADIGAMKLGFLMSKRIIKFHVGKARCIV